MSLINKMLQDLEQRRVDVTAGAAMHDQVRAVAPESKRINAVWWLVLLLGVSLLAMSAWLWLRPAPVARQVTIEPPNLALKLAPDLSAVTLRPQQDLPIEEKSAVPQPMAMPEPALNTDANSTARSEQRGDQNPAKQATPPAIVNVPPPSIPATPTAAAVRAKAPDSVAPANINKQVRELTPQQRAENQYRKATSLMQQGKNADAIAELEQALQTDPLHTAARQTLVGLLVEGKRQDEAMRRLQDGLNLDPNQPGLAMILARLQVEKGDLRLALATLQRSLPFAANRADYQAFLAALLQRDKRHKEAADHYLAALRNAQQNEAQTGVWWMGLGISLQAENRVADALDAFGRAKASNTLSAELQAFVDQKLNQLQQH